MIDQGFCFNAGEWNDPDAALRGLYARNRVYEGVSGMESFGPWIDRLESRMNERVLDEMVREIPPDWYEGRIRCADAADRAATPAPRAGPGPFAGREAQQPAAISELEVRR